MKSECLDNDAEYKLKQFEEILIAKENVCVPRQGPISTTCQAQLNDNEDLTDNESSNQEGSDSEEIVELE